VQPLWKSVWKFHTNLKIELSYDSTAPLLGTELKEGKSGYNRGNCAPMFMAKLFTITKL
jgi:hypothetical protein